MGEVISVTIPIPALLIVGMFLLAIGFVVGLNSQ